MKTKIRINSKIIITIIMMFIVGIGYAQIKGNGNVITEDRNTGDFTGIKLACSADVFISQGSTSVKVKVDENIIKLVKTTVEDGVLKIDVKGKSIRSVTVFEVYISLPSLDMLKNSGSGDIEFKGTFKANDLFIGNNGSGDIDAEFDVTNLELKLNGSGDIELEGINGTFKVSNSGSGDVDVEGLKLEECYVKGAGSGDIDLSGKTNNLTITNAGSGDVSAYNLTAVNASVSNSGSADITLNVVEKLQARLNGSGDVTYRGDPQVEVKSSGSGEVYKK